VGLCELVILVTAICWLARIQWRPIYLAGFTAFTVHSLGFPFAQNAPFTDLLDWASDKIIAYCRKRKAARFR